MSIIIAEIFAFIATVFCAFYLDWVSADIVWGLWITSLLIGYTRILYLASVIGKAASSANILAGIGAALFFIAFFTFHFGLFHYVHSVFLHHFFPLPGLPESTLSKAGKTTNPHIWSVIITCISNYWPLILGGYLVLFKKALLPGNAVNSRDTTEAIGSKRAHPKPSSPRNLMSSTSLRDVYSTVVRMHILIILMGFLTVLKLDQLALILVLLFFFFPFEEVTGILRKNSE